MGLTLARVFIPFSLGYFLSYLFRVVNAVVGPELTADLGLGPADLGLLTSAYFLTFAAFQLPLGLLLDHFGPRRVETVLLLFAALGSFLFSIADGLSGLVIGRALIGFGVSACLMAAFKAYVMWFPKDKLPMVNGFQMAVGALGALTGTVPVELALGLTDWRGVFVALAVLALAIAALIFFTVPDRPAHDEPPTFAQQMAGVRNVFTSAVFWRIAPLTVVSQATFLSIQSLWTGPWLRDNAGLARTEAAEHLMMIAAAMVAGFALLGVLATRWTRFGLTPTAIAVAAMTVSIIALGLIGLYPGRNAFPLWLAFAFFGTAGILPYAALSQHFHARLAGRVNTALNLLVFVLAFAFQWGVGAVIGLWPETAAGGYAPEGYQTAFLMLVGLQCGTLAWFFLFKPKA